MRLINDRVRLRRGGLYEGYYYFYSTTTTTTKKKLFVPSSNVRCNYRGNALIRYRYDKCRTWSIKDVCSMAISDFWWAERKNSWFYQVSFFFLFFLSSVLRVGKLFNYLRYSSLLLFNSLLILNVCTSYTGVWDY